MATSKSWIKAARLRTLPLALAGILMGCLLAWFYGGINWTVSVLAILTATLIQVFSNFANDYGDYEKGTDNEARVGPTRTMQSGDITRHEMKWGMILIGGLSFLLGVLLVFFGTWYISITAFFIFIGLGILSLIAAYFYTAGKRSYGYVGLGDLAVFLFFGLLPVLGVFYLNTGYLAAEIILPALTLGFFSAGVLNLNNMRDVVNDQESGKITLAVRMGERNSRIYHIGILFWGWMSTVIFTMHQLSSHWHWLFFLCLPIFLLDLIKVVRTQEAVLLDPFLKRLALSTLLFVVLFGLGLIL